MSRPALADEVVVVTGGAQGIGAAIVEAAAEQGARVGLVDLRPADDAAVPWAQADVSDAASLREALAFLRTQIGTPTVLVNNAGRNAYADPIAMTEEEWNDVFSVDLKSAWLCARELLPDMVAAAHGSIVNIASLHSTLTTRGMFPYAAAKSGLVGLTRSLALEVASHGIRVNAVSPGYVRTALVEEYFATTGDPEVERAVLDVHPLGRIGTPAEVAAVVCFLASRAASYVTGANWAVDGGLGSRFA